MSNEWTANESGEAKMSGKIRRKLPAAVTIALAWSLAASVSVGSLIASADQPATATPPASAAPVNASPTDKLVLDRSGRLQTGKASFYASRYSGKTMADGTPMRLYSNNAASVTLPLGTVARVTNLETGRSAVITIRDRGPYVRGRIVDLSPATARKIGLERRKGLADVEVAPLTVPMADGTTKIVRTVTMAAN
jgi:rare lipoprotein A